MKTIRFASQNPNKIREVQTLLPQGILVAGIEDLTDEELSETGDTLEENALQKARAVAQISGQPSFADDTGLEVEALNGEPGVYSARYAGPQKSSADNINLILQKLEGVDNRNARFRTVIAWVNGKEERLFEGTVNGTISKECSGMNGFGYDPIFTPEGSTRTFAEMSMTDKNMISHRARAVSAFADFLKSQG